MPTDRHYFTIQTADGYRGAYATREDAEHARRLAFGNRALAHSIIRVTGAPRNVVPLNPSDATMPTDPNQTALHAAQHAYADWRGDRIDTAEYECRLHAAGYRRTAPLEAIERKAAYVPIEPDCDCASSHIEPLAHADDCPIREWFESAPIEPDGIHVWQDNDSMPPRSDRSHERERLYGDGSNVRSMWFAQLGEPAHSASERVPPVDAALPIGRGARYRVVESGADGGRRTRYVLASGIIEAGRLAIATSSDDGRIVSVALDADTAGLDANRRGRIAHAAGAATLYDDLTAGIPRIVFCQLAAALCAVADGKYDRARTMVRNAAHNLHGLDSGTI